jgi:tetratricopeptide (TPR) repeat protein
LPERRRILRHPNVGMCGSTRRRLEWIYSIAMAVALSQAGAETAVAYFDQAVRLVPNDAAALYGRGKARQLKGDIAAAMPTSAPRRK